MCLFVCVCMCVHVFVCVCACLCVRASGCVGARYESKRVRVRTDALLLDGGRRKFLSAQRTQQTAKCHRAGTLNVCEVRLLEQMKTMRTGT